MAQTFFRLTDESDKINSITNEIFKANNDHNSTRKSLCPLAFFLNNSFCERHYPAFMRISYLRVLEPHLQPLHGQKTGLFVAASCGEQTQQIPGHVVHRLPAVQLIPQDVQHIVFHTLCQLLIPIK